MTQKERKRRVTPQRAAIHRALRQAGGFRTAQELHEELRRDGHAVGLATVYRELQNLTDENQIDALANPEGETIYRLCASEEHHHHLVCRTCGTTVEIAGDEVEEWAHRAARSHGFTSVVHVAELYGFCGRCAPSSTPRVSGR